MATVPRLVARAQRTDQRCRFQDPSGEDIEHSKRPLRHHGFTAIHPGDASPTMPRTLAAYDADPGADERVGYRVHRGAPHIVLHEQAVEVDHRWRVSHVVRLVDMGPHKIAHLGPRRVEPQPILAAVMSYDVARLLDIGITWHRIGSGPARAPLAVPRFDRGRGRDVPSNRRHPHHVLPKRPAARHQAVRGFGAHRLDSDSVG